MGRIYPTLTSGVIWQLPLSLGFLREVLRVWLLLKASGGEMSLSDLYASIKWNTPSYWFDIYSALLPPVSYMWGIASLQVNRDLLLVMFQGGVSGGLDQKLYNLRKLLQAVVKWQVQYNPPHVTNDNSSDNRDVEINESNRENLQFGNKITGSDNPEVRIIGIQIIGRLLYPIVYYN